MGLWRHKNTCKVIRTTSNNDTENFKNSISDSLSVFEIIKQNNEFKELLVEQNKYIYEQCKKQLEKIQETHKEQNQEFKELIIQQNKQHNELINKFIEKK